MTVTSSLDLSITIVPWLFSGIYAPGALASSSPCGASDGKVDGEEKLVVFSINAVY